MYLPCEIRLYNRLRIGTKELHVLVKAGNEKVVTGRAYCPFHLRHK